MREVIPGDKPSLTYHDAGVNISAGNALIERIKSVSQATKRPEVLSGLGGFSALCEIPKGYHQPVLVSGTDGVGTKLKLAIELGKHDFIGIDLVAMCSNDIAVVGAEPLLFLDYYATAKLNIDIAAKVIAGIGDGCKLAGAALVGGETAEMPGMYEGEDYDLAGFCVGIVEKSRIIDGSLVSKGDTLIALPSSGPHANGYSLIRKIISITNTDTNTPFEDGKSLSEVLLEPTTIYNRPLLELQQKIQIHAMAHITGGGLLENLPRVLPKNCRAHINLNSWRLPTIFQWLQEKGNIERNELFRTFNCGVGMVLVVERQQTDLTLEYLHALNIHAWHIGDIVSGGSGVYLSE